jgi:hypothetical protein
LVCLFSVVIHASYKIDVLNLSHSLLTGREPGLNFEVITQGFETSLIKMAVRVGQMHIFKVDDHLAFLAWWA